MSYGHILPFFKHFFSFLGHRYGNTLVPMSTEQKENMKYNAVKCFKILDFTKADKVSEIIARPI